MDEQYAQEQLARESVFVKRCGGGGTIGVGAEIRHLFRRFVGECGRVFVRHEKQRPLFLDRGELHDLCGIEPRRMLQGGNVLFGLRYDDVARQRLQHGV